jgi:DNA invertase Pin-like site-specific DNA recombinase
MDETERPALARCLDMAAAGDYDVLLVYDLSRLARSVRLQENWVWQLARCGVEVASVTEPHAGDDLVRPILAAVNQRERRVTAGKVRMAIRERTARGLPWGVAPLGLRRGEDGRYEPDPATAHVAREIVEAYADGAGLTALADDLTERGVPTPRGHARWRIQTIRYLLANPAYAGLVVDAETWARAQARLASGRRAPRRKAWASWLEGRVRHGCGAPMYLVGPAGRMTGPAFRCKREGGRSAGDPGCGLRPAQVSAARLEAEVWRLVVAALEQKRDALDVYEELVERARRSSPLVDRRRREAERRVDSALRRRDRAESLYLDGSRDRAWFDAEDARLTTELAAAEAALAALPAAPDLEELRATERELREHAENIGDIHPADRGTVLDRLGTTVGVGSQGVWVQWREDFARFLAEK